MCIRDRQLGGAASGTEFEPETDEDVDGLSGLPAHALTEIGANPREVYVESLQKWFDVRARYLQWTDGRLAQMLSLIHISAMPAQRPPRPPLVAALPTLRRNLVQWWRSQSPASQDRFATLGPLLSVLLFLAAIISAFWYLRNEEIERETESVKRDTEITQQQIGLRLIQNQEGLIRLARDLVARDVDTDEFAGQAAAFMRERPEMTHLTWVDGRRRVRASQWALLYPGAGAMPAPALPKEGGHSEPESTFRAARDTRTPAYSRAFVDAAGGPVFQLHVPLDVYKRQAPPRRSCRRRGCRRCPRPGCGRGHGLRGRRRTAAW